MTNIVIADDSESFVEIVEELINDKDIESATCVTTIEAAEEVITKELEIRCFIADLVFEGSSQDGLFLLELVKGRYPKAECILLTGYVLADSQLEQLRKIGGGLLYKTNLSADLLLELLSGEYKLKDMESSLKAEMDVGELRLRYEKINAILDEVISDIYEELESIENKDEPCIFAGIKKLSVKQLKKHLEAKDEIGTELIEMYQALNRRLRGGQL